MMSRILLLAAHFLLVLLFIVITSDLSIAQIQVTLDASKDNTLYESTAGDVSNGAGDAFFTGRTNQPVGSSIRRGLLAFNVAGSIPAGATVLSATLTLHLSRTSSAAQIVSLHRAIVDWGEGTSVAAGDGGSGTTATTNDATWLHKFFNTAFWASPGGDFSATISASQSVADTASYMWGSTVGMVSDVQNWLNTPSTNFGWVLIGNESAAPTSKRFDTRETASASLRPKLTVTYTPATGVGEGQNSPQVFALYQNYPNPFNPTTNIGFRIAKYEFVSLKVFNLLGQEIATLVNENLIPGEHNRTWDASGMSSGFYIYRLQTSSFLLARAMVLVR